MTTGKKINDKFISVILSQICVYWHRKYTGFFFSFITSLFSVKTYRYHRFCLCIKLILHVLTFNMLMGKYMINSKVCIYREMKLWMKMILCTNNNLTLCNMCPLTAVSTSSPEEDGEGSIHAGPHCVGGVHIWDVELTLDLFAIQQASNFCRPLIMSCHRK